MNTFEKTLTMLGVVFLSALMIAIPILTACSFTLDWPGNSQFGLVMFTSIEYFMLLAILSKLIEH